MTIKATQLSRECLGTRTYKYTVGVTQEVDGTMVLVVAATGTDGEHRMPEPARERRPFTGTDIDDLDRQVNAFLREWREECPDRRNQILCCTKVVSNALTRARTKLAAGPNPPHPHRTR